MDTHPTITQLLVELRETARVVDEEGEMTNAIEKEANAMTDRIAELETENAKMRAALEWYRDEAHACARHHGSDAPGSAHALLASIVVLALDNGRRATAAIDAAKE